MSQLVRTRSLLLALLVALTLAALPATARAATGGASPGTGAGTARPAATAKHSGGAAPGSKPASRRRHARRRVRRTPVVAPAPPTAPATLLADGTAAAPPGAPAEAVAAIAAGNRIASMPYRWGGGHARWEDVGYDCSGSVGYALYGAGLLDAPVTSGDLMRYGERGPGTWITVYANRDHVYMVVAGLRFDTSGANPSRWQATPRPSAGYEVRHPPGL